MERSHDTIGTAVKRLNVGCGPCVEPGWLNADRLEAEGIDFPCDIRAGLPVESDSFDYIVGMHMLQDVPYPDVLPVLRELRRVLKPYGILRLGLPDLDKAMEAYLRGDHAYFYVRDDDAENIGSKLVTQLVWYGSVRTPFTYDFIEEWLRKAGFRDVNRCAFEQTYSVYPAIVQLDNRERESFFVEAGK
jgi:SAM-dependent methyltransferase